jgi:hypothetical protein
MANKQWSTYLLIGVLLLIWGWGLRDAISGGLTPGYVRHPQEHPYPTKNVATTCAIITGELVLLFAILRPFGLSTRRALIALVVFGILLITEFLLFSGSTDSPAYAYSNNHFLLFVVGFLALIAVYDRITQ